MFAHSAPGYRAGVTLSAPRAHLYQPSPWMSTVYTSEDEHRGAISAWCRLYDEMCQQALGRPGIKMVESLLYVETGKQSHSLPFLFTHFLFNCLFLYYHEVLCIRPGGDRPVAFGCSVFVRSRYRLRRRTIAHSKCVDQLCCTFG